MTEAEKINFELLSLLEDAAGFLESMIGDNDEYGRPIIDDDDVMLAEMRAAIAKAKGWQ